MKKKIKKAGLPFITDRTDLKGKRVIVRASLNVPVRDGVVQNYFRIMRALPTLMYLIHHGARVIILAHIGRDPKETLEPVYNVLRDQLPVTYVPKITGRKVEKVLAELEPGSAILLENVRSEEGEIANDQKFAETLATYGDLYVNDAFPVSHREQASIVGIPQYLPSYFGLAFREEYSQLMKAINPSAPALFISGGAKSETKRPLLEKYVKKYDHVFVAGVLANDFFVARGYEVGTSLVSKDPLTDSVLLNHEKVLLPVDVVVQGGSTVRVTTPDDVQPNERIVDAGPQSLELLNTYIQKAATILWNGPLGSYEEGFEEHTKICAEYIAASKGYSIVGGGDTVAAIESLALNDKFGFLSAAGGAMLQFLGDGTLSGIRAVMTDGKV